MLSMKYAKPVRNILILAFVGVFSFFVVTSWLPNRSFIKDSIESVEESSNTASMTTRIRTQITAATGTVIKHCGPASEM